jgi:hypothetical protein
MSAEQQQELLDEAERRAEELRILQERASAIVAAVLTASLLAALPSIRRAYRRYLEALRPPTTDPTGATYRPPAGSGQQAAKRLAELQAAAAAFASDRDMAKLERELAAVMKAAAEHGTRYAVSMGTIQGMAIGERVPIPDEIIRARLAGITATVKAQTTGFRGVLSSIVADGASRSKPLKRIEDDLLRAFRGEQSPDGETLARGLMQGLDVHVTTEVSVISDDQAMRAMRASGAEYVRWITAQDEKVCPYCASRHGRIYLADRISIPAHPRCVPGDAHVSPGPLTAAFRAFYRGNLITVRLQDGDRLSVTANHPMLTERGWVKAEALRKGDKLINQGPISNGGLGLPGPDLYQVPARAADVFAALAQSSSVVSVSVPVAPLDLHGDGAFIEGHVNVVRANRLLQGHWDSPAGQNVCDGLGERRDMRFAPFAGLSTADKLGLGLNAASRGSVARLSDAQALLRGGLSHAEEHRLAAVALNDPSLVEPVDDHAPINPELLGQFLDAQSGVVTLNEVVNVQSDPWHGYVYSFETFSGIYSVGRLGRSVTGNCRCGAAAVPAEQVLSDPLIRDDVLDAPFWQEEERRTVLVYAEAKGLDEAEARRRLADHLQRPTQAEKARYPGVERSVPPSYEPPPYDPATTEVVGIGV